MAEANDGVNRNGLDYRAGWCEALRALRQCLAVEGLRVKKNVGTGLDLASSIAKRMYDEMIAKMRGAS